MKPDLSKILSTKPAKDQFERRMRYLESLKPPMVTKNIRAVVGEASASLLKGHRSFVIYGDPQSGKTEMMIGLNAKLLDMGYPVIINLVNDSVDMLNQNKVRFTEAGLNPAPKIYDEVEKIIPELRYVFLSTKNAKNLENLNDLVKKVEGKNIVVIDDEADHATPNTKVNKAVKSRVNELIGSLLRHKKGDMQGAYIGVTATPARLDLNATFENESEQWIYFPPHDKYVGQDIFFPPVLKNPEYRLMMFQNTGDERKKLREAILSFLCNVAHLNTEEGKEERNFSMLIHTSGKMIEQREDEKILNSLISDLSNPKSRRYQGLLQEALDIAYSRFPQKTEKIVRYIADNIPRERVGMINSNTKAKDRAGILNPAAPFTFAIGGNIVSRGLTFANLLSMYFTRTVKTKFQQDTYIQRARMFGARDKSLLPHFELWIPEALFREWHTCFSYHKMSVEAIKEKRGAPVWIAGGRIVPVQSSSIDRAAVNIEDGEMSFGMFDYAPEGYSLMNNISAKSNAAVQKLDELHKLLGDDVFPRYICNYIQSRVQAGEDVFFHPRSIIGRSGFKSDEIKNIRRVKGFFGASQMANRPEIHHLRMFSNQEGKARLFYKLRSESVRFLKRIS